MIADLKFLNKVDGKFDPFEAAITDKTAPDAVKIKNLKH